MTLSRPLLWVARVALTGLGLLAGCSVGPNYERPAPFGSNAMPGTFAGTASNATTPWKTAEPSAHLERGNWWTVFGDAELGRLESLADARNQDLAVAAARFANASAVVTLAGADRWPQVTATPSAVRQRTSENQPQRGRAAGEAYTFDTLTLGLTAGWELDLWGRVRQQTSAAQARVEASGDELASVRLAIQAEVAVDYFARSALWAEEQLLQSAIAAYRRSLELTRNRRAGGIATDLDVAQAETQLKSAEAQVPVVRLQRIKLEHALAVLCGQPATTFSLPDAATGLPAPPPVPVSLPGELLERRPDIAAAERRMAAANADAGVARTAFYPRIRIGGLAGLQSVDTATLVDWPSRLWAVGPSLDWPLFTGGRTRAQQAVARAAYDERVALYRQTLLLAFQEVEDRLAAQSLLASQEEAERAALTAAQRTLTLAENRYKAGLITYVEVALAQGAALSRERTVVELQASRLATSVGLIKALGGGWSVTPTPPSTK